MLVEALQVGMLGTNCYVVAANPGGDAAVIDPGGDLKAILATLKRHELKCTAILCTHGHMDHVAAAGPLSAATGAPVMVHPEDAGALSALRARLLGGVVGGVVPARLRSLEMLEPGRAVAVGELQLQVLHTPGHTRGSVSFYAAPDLFCGDLIFQGSIGRTDLRGGSMADLLASVKEKVFVLPEDTRIMTGHGPRTTLAAEKRSNPYLRDL